MFSGVFFGLQGISGIMPCESISYCLKSHLLPVLGPDKGGDSDVLLSCGTVASLLDSSA
jgi:hypothetical protein